ncbi:MAG: class B sortase [Eubacterium sp.]|nr:class B sortase [Eubacterium sp.]
MARQLLKWLNRVLNLVVILTILAAIAYSLYSIWDNNSIYAAALSLTARIRQEKPSGDKPSFDDLRKINPDVCAWITMDGTNIDNPIVQGEDNEEYLNKDVYGKYSLAGTIFLDTRCSRDFQDFDEVIYGHHMDQHAMFGDLDLYLKKAFFDKHTTGTLLIPGKKIPVSVLSVMVVKDTDSWVFDPVAADEDPSGFLQYLETGARYVHADTLAQVREDPASWHILTLSTCSSDQEDDRTVVFAAYQIPS